MSTPSEQLIATMVVACALTSAAMPGGSGRRPGSISGATAERNSLNDEVPAA
jgi:hypothetical protein